MRTRAKGFLAALAVAVMVIALATGASAATKSAVIDVKSVTGVPVPVSFTMNQIREAIGVDFAANWDSLRVEDSAGNSVPFQLDDVDLSGGASRVDELAFLATGPVKIVVSDESPESKPSFDAAFEVEPAETGGFVVRALDGLLTASVSKYATVDLISFKGVEHKYARDIGMIRYAGFPYSTYWYDENLDRHEEKTTFEEPIRIVKSAALPGGPVRATVVAQTASDLFPGLRQSIVVSIYKTGEVRVNNRLVTAGYSDLTKLFTMCGGVMGDVEDARHILPVFRWTDWADELGISSEEYWAGLGVITRVDGQPYITFADARGPKPAWWGASYLFCSPERWRTNFSAGLKLGVAECLMDVPELPADLVDKLKMDHWHLEGEWRTGPFRWIASEIVDFRAKSGIKVDIMPDMNEGNWPVHMIPGDTVERVNYYLLYEASDAPSAIRYLENRYAELAGVVIK